MAGGDADRRSAFAAEAKRLHERYTVEVVERFNVCPWARHARAAGEVEREVLLQRDEAIEPTLELLARIEADPRRLPVVIAIYPRLAIDPRGFDRFAALVRDADQKRHGGRPVYVSATFHPDFPYDARSPASLVPFLRRSPDPSLQLVRLDVLDAARGKSDHGTYVFDFSAAAWDELRRRAAAPPLAERIAIDNQRTVEEEGRERFEALFRALIADRDASYAPFADLP
jgi:hypothetical protein